MGAAVTDQHDDVPLQIEFSRGPGVQQVALVGPEAIERSAQALNDAMGIIRQMADRVRATVVAMPVRPEQVEVAFGIKFDAQAGALIAKAGVEAAISIAFRWDLKHPGPSPAAVLDIDGLVSAVDRDVPADPAHVAGPPAT
jgi:hypothetical protein